MAEQNTDNLESSNQDDTGSDAVVNSGTLQETASEIENDTVPKNVYLNQKTRAERAEAELKALKGQKVEPKPQAQTSDSSVDVDERVLRANGMPQELLKELKAIAQVRGLNLIDAQSDSLFVAVKSEFDKKEKSKLASVGASRGSGQVQVQKTLDTPGLSREEHKKLVKG